MNKSNFVTLMSYVILIAVVFLFSYVETTPFESSSAETDDNSIQGEVILDQPSTPVTALPDVESPEVSTPATEEDPAETENEVETENPAETENPVETETISPEAITISMDDALFIGDSRTVGIMEYAQIEGADFFANVGMSVYNIHDDPVSVSDVGEVTLTELLSTKNYGKIYIMLGINEVGYVFENTVAKYGELIDFIKEKQPNAVIFIQASLHVTKSRSDSDDVINNNAINKLNAAQSKFANGNDILYIDANVVFDDETGSLASDKTGDDVHLYAKHYLEWGQWIREQTQSLIG